MTYEIKSETTTKPTKIKCEPLWINLTDEIGQWIESLFDDGSTRSNTQGQGSPPSSVIERI